MSRTPRSTPQVSPHRRTVPKPRTNLASSAALSENEPVASGSGSHSRSHRLLAPRNLATAASSPPVGGKNTHHAARKVCVRLRPARNSRRVHVADPAAPLVPPTLPGSHHLPRRRGGCAEGWDEKGAEQAPPFPIPRPQLSGKGCTQPPGLGRRHLPSSGVRTRLLTVRPVQLPVSPRRRCRPPLSSQPCSPGPGS